MLKLSKKTEYAVIALMHMAENSQNGLNTAKEISIAYNIPRELMNKVLQRLAKSDIITSHQGVKGGYQLQRSIDEINFSAIISAVEGPISLIDCVHMDACGCDQLDYCNIKTPMEFIQSELEKFFDGITLSDFKRRSRREAPLIRIEG
jgi:Rrf2 family protein